MCVYHMHLIVAQDWTLIVAQLYVAQDWTQLQGWKCTLKFDLAQSLK